MSQQKRRGMARFFCLYLLGGDFSVNWTTAIVNDNIFLGNLLGNEPAEISVRNKENVFVGQIFDDFNDVR